MATIGVHAYTSDTNCWRENVKKEVRNLKDLKDLSNIQKGVGQTFVHQ